MTDKKIVLTGGGTAGHITPNIALFPRLAEEGFELFYIGSNDGMEERLLRDLPVKYFGVNNGKIRRSLDLKNLATPFRVYIGTLQSRKILKEIKPDIVFSKGGYVSVPVLGAASSLNIPYIIHESDISPGLANKVCFSHAAKICCNFPETLQLLPREKAVLTGLPIRQELMTGNRIAALDLCGFSANKPVLVVTGGSLGSQVINEAVRSVLDRLLVDFQIAHICGRGKIDESLSNMAGYKQFGFLRAEMKDVLAMADVVVSRAGANTICELLALKKPHLLVPLDAGSRGDQIENAKSFEASGYSVVLDESTMIEKPSLLADRIYELYFNRQTFIRAMNDAHMIDPVEKIINLIKEVLECSS